jgi:hypothetical protein
MLGTQITLAGVRGFIPVAEAAAVIMMMNFIMQDNVIPIPEEWIQGQANKLRDMAKESDHPKAYRMMIDTFTNGLPSALSGYDISPTINSPGFGQFASIPIIKWTLDGLIKGFTYLLHKWKGVATEADEMASLTAISPLAFSGQISEAYSMEGEPVPRPADQMQGNYTRTENEKLVAKILSMKSIDETRADAIIRVIKQNLALDMKNRTNLLNAMSSHVRKGEGLPPELIQQYVEEGGNPNNLLQALTQARKNEMLDFEQRKMQGTVSPGKAHTSKELDLLRDSK